MRELSYTLKMNLITLGELRLTGSDFQRHKPMLLLCFLALEGARPRRYLAELFYSDAKNPLNSLSRALSHLRGVDADLQTDDATVATTIDCDAKQLEQLLDRGQLEQGIELYGAPFLQGVTLDLSSELEEWVLVTREHIAGRVREAHLRLGETLAAQGKFDSAARHAETAYKLPGANELEPEDFARTYALLSAGHSPQAADIRKEAASFGIRLFLSSDDARAQLFIEQNESLPLHNLPRRRTSFVGRGAELREVREVFSDARYRLLTLLGPGGVGKSRLAVEAAYRQVRDARFQDGTTLVELDPVTSPELIPGAIAEALKLELRGADDPLTQITKHIGSSARLLILDNFEHLIEGADLVRNLLDACPHLSILVTSRERLNLADEWVLGLTGLSVEKCGGAGSDALQLFVERAKRARLGFSLTHEELPHAQAICDLVSGFPLGIELAAVWIKLLSPADIAAEIKQNLSFLESPTRDVTERQRSINAAFEYSWKLLSAEEQTVTRKLSVFNGGFRKEAAAQVAGASLPILASLVDKSLLLVNPGSRYERHRLLFQFSQEKLAEQPQEASEAKAKHAQYFHSFLKRAETDLRGPRAREAMDTIELEFKNIRLAWGWAVEHEDAEALVHSAIPLRLFFDRRGRFQEGVEFYNQVINKLDKSKKGQQSPVGHAFVSASWLYFRLGRSDEATNSATKGIALLKLSNKNKGIIEGLATLSVLEWQAGRYKVAMDHAQAALTLTNSNDLATIARLSEYLGIVNAALGSYVEAKKYYKKALNACRQSDNKAASVTVLHNLGTLEVKAGKVDEAETFLMEGLELSRRLNIKQSIPPILNNLAKVAMRRNDFSSARLLCQEALQITEIIGRRSYQARIQETLGRVALENGEHHKAKKHFTETLKIAHDTHEIFMALQALTWIAQIYANEDEAEQAANLLGLVQSHPATSGYLHNLTQQALEKLSGLLSAPTLKRALEQGGKLELHEIIEAILGNKNLLTLQRSAPPKT